MMFRFEKLDVWNKSIEFASRVYEDTRLFPENERFGLMSQMRRAAVSISSNVAEGSGRSSNKDFARFVEMAYSSLMEVISQTQLAHRQEFLSQDFRDEMYDKANELARMLSGLKSYVLSSKT